MDMQNGFQNLNWLAIVVAAVSAFILGGLWYCVVSLTVMGFIIGIWQ